MIKHLMAYKFSKKVTFIQPINPKKIFDKRYPIGTKWVDTSNEPFPVWERQENMWKFIGYQKDNALFSIDLKRRIIKPHKKDIPLIYER